MLVHGGLWHLVLGHGLGNFGILDVRRWFVMFRLGMGHYCAKVGVLDAHVGVGVVHHGRGGQAMTQLGGEA